MDNTLARHYGSRNGILMKGKRQILALSTSERNQILKRLDAYEKQLFTRVSNFCYYEGKRYVKL